MIRLPPEIACFLIVLIILGVMAGAWAIRNWRPDKTDEEFWP